MNDLTTPVIDPITLEMLWRRLVSIVGELGSTLRRTSFSTVVRDIGDYGCGIFDAEGRLLAQTPDSTPGLCGPLGSMLRHMLVAHPPAAAPCPHREDARRVALAIGPEGGWVPFEIELLASRGFRPVSLGPRVLRVETVVPLLVGMLR